MVQHGQNCMGCGGCETVCPKSAITLCLAEDGFFRPTIQPSLCVDCGLCDAVCPVDHNTVRAPIAAFGYQSRDKAVLSQSASGGFGYELSCQQVKKQPICSVEYDKATNRPEHKVADSEEELFLRRNSIYLQSYTPNGFRDILQREHGVIIGSPCQISFLNNWLIQKKKRDNYLLVDFFCHGVPSYNLWKKYIEEHPTVFAHPTDVVFRAKTFGWGNFTIDCRNAQQHVDFDKARDDDLFFRVFLENMALNQPCYTCPYHATASAADIRIGDFWGEKYKGDKEGITGLLAFTEKGLAAIKDLADSAKISTETVDEVLSGQITEPLKVPSCRDKLLQALASPKTLQQINKSVIFKYKLKRKIARMLKKEFI